MAISPSQLKTAFDPETGCLRKWGHQQIDGEREPPTASTQLGTDTHAQLERYHRSAFQKPGENLPLILPDNSDPGILAQQLISKIPKPRKQSPTWPGPEFGFAFSVGNVDYKGFIDLPYVANADEWPYKDNCAVVEDYKTTKNLKYALTSDQLATDYQRVIYSIAVLRHFDTEYSAARWDYVQTQATRDGFPTLQVEYGPESADKTLLVFESGVHPKAVELTRLRRFKARDLPQNFGACHAYYRKCAFYDRCHSQVTVDGAPVSAAAQLKNINSVHGVIRSDQPTIRAEAKEILMGNALLAQMRAGVTPVKPDNQNAPPPTPPVSEPTAAVAATAPVTGGFMAGLFGKKTAAQAPTPAPVAPVEEPPMFSPPVRENIPVPAEPSPDPVVEVKPGLVEAAVAKFRGVEAEPGEVSGYAARRHILKLILASESADVILPLSHAFCNLRYE
jgi:hypothetical protein